MPNEKPEYCDGCEKTTNSLTMHIETEQEYPGAHVWRTEVWLCKACNEACGYVSRPVMENTRGW